MRNTAFGAREGEGKSLPRGEGFRVRVTYTKASSLPMEDKPPIYENPQQVI